MAVCAMASLGGLSVGGSIKETTNTDIKFLLPSWLGEKKNIHARLI